MEYAVHAGVAAVGASLYLGYKALQPPKTLAHTPEISLFSLIYSFIRGEPIDKIYDKVYQPVLESNGYARMWMLTRWEVVASDPKIVREILSRADDFLKTPPGGDPSLKRMLITKLLGESNIIISDGEVWRRHRKVSNPAFKKQWSTEMFGNCSFELISKLEEANGAPIIVNNQFQRLTLDALGLGIFSHNFEAVKKGEKSHYLNVYNEIIEAGFRPLYQMLPILESIIPSRNYYHKRKDEFRQFLADMIIQRRQDIKAGVELGDLLSLMIKASDDEADENVLSDEEVLNDLATFFLAGHDTTANTLASTFYYLSKHQEIQQRAREEVLGVLGDSGEVVVPSIEQLKQMPYINCIIKESMRIITTVGQLRRFTSKDVTLSCGLSIPENTCVIAHTWGAHRDPEIFPDPDRFNPDRFEELHGSQDSNWMAFGSGSRMCIGTSFSLVEQRVVMSMLLQKFTFDLGPNARSSPDPKMLPVGLAFPVDLDLIFTPRF